MENIYGNQHGNKTWDTKTTSAKNVQLDDKNRMCGRLQDAGPRVITDKEIKNPTTNSKHLSGIINWGMIIEEIVVWNE